MQVADHGGSLQSQQLRRSTPRTGGIDLPSIVNRRSLGSEPRKNRRTSYLRLERPRVISTTGARVEAGGTPPQVGGNHEDSPPPRSFKAHCKE